MFFTFIFLATTDPRDTPVALKSPVYKKSWFIAVVVVVCFLLLVLLAMLLITRKRGERYPGKQNFACYGQSEASFMFYVHVNLPLALHVEDDQG